MAHTEKALSFRAKNVEEWREWKVLLKAKLWSLLKLDNLKPVDLYPTVRNKKQKTSYTIEKVVYQSEPNVYVPATLFIPNDSRDTSKTFLSIHGHGTGARDPLYKYDKFFAERGYVVFVPEMRGFGKRTLTATAVHLNEDCLKLHICSALLGRNISGQRVWDLMRGIDYLETRPEIDKERIGCGGLSMGGQLSMLLAALDDRIKISMISGFLSSFKGLLYDLDNCVCYLIPEILEFADMWDIAGLIAPKPLLIEKGTDDPCFKHEDVLLAYQHLKHIYNVIGEGDKIDIDVFEGRHEFSGRKSLDWFNRWL